MAKSFEFKGVRFRRVEARWYDAVKKTLPKGLRYLWVHASHLDKKPNYRAYIETDGLTTQAGLKVSTSHSMGEFSTPEAAVANCWENLETDISEAMVRYNRALEELEAFRKRLNPQGKRVAAHRA